MFNSGDLVYLSAGLVVGVSYGIYSLGTGSQANWNTLAGTSGITYIVGSIFTCASSAVLGDGVVYNNATKNVAIGYNSGYNISSGSNNVVIGGYTGSATPISGAGNNFIVLSDGAGTVRQTHNASGSLAFDTAGTAFGTSGQVLQSNGNAAVPTWVTPATSLTGGVTGSVPYQSNTGVTAMTAAGTTGQVLTTVTTGAAPTWQTPTGTQRVTTLVTPTVGTTVFTVTYTVGYLDVFYNGIKLVLADDYVATNGTSVTLSSATIAGDVIEFVTYTGITLGAAAPSTLTISNKTAAYTVVAGDNGTILNWTSGTFTVTLTAAATLGVGFNVWIWNTGTGVVTIDTNLAETIDGIDPVLLFNLTQGSGIRLVCNGTGWYTTDVRMSGSAGAGVSAVQLGRSELGESSRALNLGSVALGGSFAGHLNSFAAINQDATGNYGAQGKGSIAMGYRAKTIGQGSIALSTGTASERAVATGSAAVCIGQGNMTGSGSFGFGNQCVSLTDGKTILSTVSYVNSGLSEGAFGLFPCSGSTTNATPKRLISGYTGYAAGATNIPTLYNNSIVAFEGTVVARQLASQGTAVAAWKITGGLIRREGTAASTTLVVAPTITAISNVPAWAIAIIVDTTLGGLDITFTGAAATNIRCLCQLQMTELSNCA